jgi:ribonuclease HII
MYRRTNNTYHLAGNTTPHIPEAGCDEAGRGCLAGPVYAAAVILLDDFQCPFLNDSKQLSEKTRYKLRPIIEQNALAWAVGIATAEEIDHINILNASILAMHRAIKQLQIAPQHLIIDGNRFHPYPNIPHQCFVKGDSRFLSIAAASVLAKTYRDDYMIKLHEAFPVYHWINNKGYPTKEHRAAILKHGISPHHRITFRLTEQQTKLSF